MISNKLGSIQDLKYVNKNVRYTICDVYYVQVNYYLLTFLYITILKIVLLNKLKIKKKKRFLLQRTGCWLSFLN